MTTFRINSNYLTNILTFNDSEITNCKCRLHINNKKVLEIPLFVAVSCFSSITRDLMADITQKDFYIDVDFNNDPDNTFYDKVISIINEEEVILEDDEIINLAVLGEKMGNNDFIIPFEQKISDIEKTLTISNCIELLKRKHDLHFDQSKCMLEINLIAENFEEKRDEILKLSLDQSYTTFIQSILSNDHLRLVSEDSLLDFVLNLCSINSTYEILFENVYLEYCTTPKVEAFINYVEERIDSTNYIHSIFECMKRRLIEPKIPKVPNLINGRHIPKLIDVTDEEPLKGIFYREQQKDNVLIEASSTNTGKVITVIRNDIYNDFATNHEPNSWIKASLKNNKSFILKKYLIRGRRFYRCEGYHHLQSWKLEGKRKDNGQWIELDRHENEPFDKLVVRVFPISCDVPLTSVKLTQISKNTGGGDSLCINAFDIFGEYEP